MTSTGYMYVDSGSVSEEMKAAALAALSTAAADLKLGQTLIRWFRPVKPAETADFRAKQWVRGRAVKPATVELNIEQSTASVFATVLHEAKHLSGERRHVSCEAYAWATSDRLGAKGNKFAAASAREFRLMHMERLQERYDRLADESKRLTPEEVRYMCGFRLPEPRLWR